MNTSKGAVLKYFTIAAVVLLVAACGGESTPVPPESTAAVSVETTEPVGTTDHEEAHGEESVEEQPYDDAPDHDETVDGHDDAAETSGRIVNVVMTEFDFEPNSVDVSAGETIRFVVVNEGVVPHEFRLSNQHRIDEHLASGHDDHGEGGGHHQEGGDIFIEVKPGETSELVATFHEDTTLYTNMACLIPGHYEAGMIGILNYTDA